MKRQSNIKQNKTSNILEAKQTRNRCTVKRSADSEQLQKPKEKLPPNSKNYWNPRETTGRQGPWPAVTTIWLYARCNPTRYPSNIDIQKTPWVAKLWPIMVQSGGPSLGPPWAHDAPQLGLPWAPMVGPCLGPWWAQAWAPISANAKVFGSQVSILCFKLIEL
jgi:hypothetical protein